MLVNFVRMFFAITLLGGVVACSSSNYVSNSSFIQKRKYQSGFHIVSRSKKTSNLNQNSIVNKEQIHTSIDSNKVSKDLLLGEKMKDLVSNNMIESNQVLDIASIDQNEPNTIVYSNHYDENIHNKSPKLLYISQEKNSTEKFIKKHDLRKFHSSSKKKSKSVEVDVYMLLLIILACIIPPLAVLLYTDVDWKKVAISLILCLFFYFPAIIYALLVLFDVL
jgi:uncharacterized membrane protein YqaE (UPF0057 family)